MVSHLQKDLATEKQDKVHIQKELDDTLTILNKPTTEMGTQTDLTAEQISRMEEKITNYQKDITQSQNQVNFLTNQISTLQTEIRGLQKQVKDKELNEAEKDLLDYVERGISTPLAGTILPNKLLILLQNEDK
ncbi:5579_t:CDS:1 [Funneliformis geosporum]|nr:5579_t:CDS:1 [Funneliformis geosporum]